jgi:NAD-specific glutamate dehydrogenase
MDAQSEPLRVVGVGDMSGDVFGNGMLQSRSTCLVAAFDHRDVFIDPTPDAGRSFAERERLSRLDHAGVLDRDVEALPTEEELSRRKQAGAGFSRPELAVLFACARSEFARSIEGPPLTGEDALTPCVLRYFPPSAVGR